MSTEEVLQKIADHFGACAIDLAGWRDKSIHGRKRIDAEIDTWLHARAIVLEFAKHAR